eukprot:TRINITY_DN8562_c0_g1_i1.p1 TRINITY_DN8562_c0_g1~~TRINITY_DN8562_c0_g1_i1.p1  ORF type:complete len:107 (+),score=11.31 TRINITY_DN8562_c0_g1_i1:535-855(+)
MSEQSKRLLSIIELRSSENVEGGMILGCLILERSYSSNEIIKSSIDPIIDNLLWHNASNLVKWDFLARIESSCTLCGAILNDQYKDSTRLPKIMFYQNLFHYKIFH